MSRTEFIGFRTVYHSTTQSGFEGIISDAQMHPGSTGMFGSAMYFADTEADARHKSRYGGNIVVKATVNFGIALVLEAPLNSMTEAQLRAQGYDSIKGRSSPSTAWEYVVFDPTRISLHFPVISELHIACRREQYDAISAIPSGYTRVNQDLCAGTKRCGDYVYLSYKITEDLRDSITNIVLEWFDNEQTTRQYNMNGKSYTRILVDLNSGARGKWIYLSYTKDRSSRKTPICEIEACTCHEGNPSWRDGWEFVCWRETQSPADTNKGAGGPYIFIRFRRF
jgi:hypothetical protein